MKLLQRAKKIVLILAPIAMATTIVSGQGAGPGQGQVFRATTNYVSTNVLVRDKDGRFIPDLKESEFRIYEDGVPQKIERFVRTIGGRAFTEIAAPAPTVRATEGLILPKTRPTVDSSGRIFIILIDDLHMQVSDTPRIKIALQEIRDKLVHENDLVGFVSTGPSGIEINPAYDFGHRRFDEAIAKTMGAGVKINEILDYVKYEGERSGPLGGSMRFNAHTAFETAYRMMDELARITDRRKSFIYVSSGYTFDPFRDGRYAQIKMRYEEVADTPTDTVDPETGLDINRPTRSPYDTDTPLADQNYMQKTEFAESELISEIAQLTREARRSNVVFYTLDPRGLTAAIPIEVRGLQTPQDWSTYIMTQTNSLRVLGEETGGFCICQTNDYTKGLQRIDAETSDYYILGYYSSNPDPLKVRRQVKIEVSRPGVDDVIYDGEYFIEKTKRNQAPSRR